MYNGVDRVDSLKGYVEGNVRSCCKECNVFKFALSEKDFLDGVARICKHQKMVNNPLFID